MFDQNRLHELISAFQKSIRWCEINESRYFARELIKMGVPNAVFGQLRIIAAEDIGLGVKWTIQEPLGGGLLQNSFEESFEIRTQRSVLYT